MGRLISTRLRLGFLLLGLLTIDMCFAEIKYPSLTGRVVDPANMISTSDEKKLNTLLATHEKATTNQVVVVTVNNLQDNTIENFGYQLGRHWGIGQKDHNNGVLLIVANSERKVRIEVGYGLEGTLTDAIAANIIQTIILPKFKQGQFSSGILIGTTAIIEALGGQYQPQALTKRRNSNINVGGIVFFLILFILFFLFSARERDKYGIEYGGGRFGGGGGYSSGGGGFFGGGGGFGGGGASGGW